MRTVSEILDYAKRAPEDDPIPVSLREYKNVEVWLKKQSIVYRGRGGEIRIMGHRVELL